MTAVIQAQGLDKRYGRRWALTDCTLDIPAGGSSGWSDPTAPARPRC